MAIYYDQSGKPIIWESSTELKPDTVRVAGADFTTTSTSLVAVTGLSLPLETFSAYDLEVHLSVAATAAAGLIFGFGFVADGVSTIEATGFFAPLVGTGLGFKFVTLNSPTTALPPSATDGTADIYGSIRADSPGTLTLQIASAAAGTATVKVGSTLTVRKVA
jgi:hypothetical protein